jgi:hypothetical protein
VSETMKGFGCMPDRLFLGVNAGDGPMHWFGVWQEGMAMLGPSRDFTVYLAVNYCEALAGRADRIRGPHDIPIKHVEKAVWMSAGNPRMRPRALRQRLERLRDLGLIEIRSRVPSEPDTVRLVHYGGHS